MTKKKPDKAQTKSFKTIAIDKKVHDVLLALQYKLTRDDYRPNVGELAERAILLLEKGINDGTQ